MITAEETEVRQIESRKFAAMVNREFAELEHILADDLTYTHSIGQLENKAEYLATLRSGNLVYQAIETEELNVRVYGDASVVTGRAKMRVGSGDQSTNLLIRFTDVYVKREGRWQLVAWQATRLAAQ
ncbi:MAG TPA: nuclear transport factor 2 family protein [Dehalococcoidia bacterium]|nr:nuclear transport factor 2 family protein [Dehalococcoidia bacterium]